MGRVESVCRGNSAVIFERCFAQLDFSRPLMPSPPPEFNTPTPPPHPQAILTGVEKDRDVRYQVAAELGGQFLKRLGRGKLFGPE